MKTCGLMISAVILGAFASAVFAQAPVERPELTPGDSWSYTTSDAVNGQVSNFVREFVERQEKSYVFKSSGTNDQDVSARSTTISFDLNRQRTINGEASDSGWFRFPLVPGKKWQNKELWINARGRNGYDEMNYLVVGNEKIAVPAGTFNTLKITGEGRWNNLDSRNSDMVEIEIWYSPELKAMVKFHKRSWERGRPAYDELTELTGAKVNNGSALVAYGKNVGEPGTVAAK
jgi:hypothetical protein